MAHNNPRSHKFIRLLAALTLGLLLVVSALPKKAAASAWDPTLLVNTEAFQIIDDGDGSSNIYLQFGDTANEKLTWDRLGSDFEFSDDLTVQGTLAVTVDVSASGALTINDDNSGDATINFGGSTVETLNFNATTGRFEFSDDVQATGNIFGSGTLSIESTAHIESNLTTSGSVFVQGTIQQQGATLEINSDAGAGDINLTFGNQSGDESLTFQDTTDRFEFTDDLSVEGNMSGNSLTVTTGTVNINGVAYSFTGSQGAASTVLTNDGAGALTWSSTSVADGSGSFISMHPEYPNTTYAGTGSAIVGQLTASGTGLTSGENYYRWSSTRSTAQRYQIVTRVQVPWNFDSWGGGSGIVLQYRTGSSAVTASYVQLKVWDTAGTLDYWGNQLATSNVFSQTRATPADLNGTYTPGQNMTVRITMMARTCAACGTPSTPADVGFMNLNWKTNTP